MFLEVVLEKTLFEIEKQICLTKLDKNPIVAAMISGNTALRIESDMELPLGKT